MFLKWKYNRTEYSPIRNFAKRRKNMDTDIKILIVEDEISIADLLERYLKNEGYLVDKCQNAKEAINNIDNRTYDLALLDLMLPDMNGLGVCEYIRKKYNYPVIILTAKSGEIDKITGLTVGADDYITKPFRPLEVVARVKAQIRRAQKYNFSYYNEVKESEMIQVGDLRISKSSREFKVQEKILTLTPTEFEIMWTLCKNAGRVVSSDELLKAIWGENYYFNSGNSIVVHVRHLREKMNDTAEHSKYIKTVWGVGYIIEK